MKVLSSSSNRNEIESIVCLTNKSTPFGVCSIQDMNKFWRYLLPRHIQDLIVWTTIKKKWQENSNWTRSLHQSSYKTESAYKYDPNYIHNIIIMKCPGGATTQTTTGTITTTINDMVQTTKTTDGYVVKLAIPDKNQPQVITETTLFICTGSRLKGRQSNFYPKTLITHNSWKQVNIYPVWFGQNQNNVTFPHPSSTNEAMKV